MFDIGFSELLVIAVVALIVLGPERLPKAARFAGLWVRRARAQWNSVKDELERELAADELKRSLHDARQAAQDLQQALHDTETGVEAQVRAAEAEARREIEGLRRQAGAGLAGDATTRPDAVTADAAADNEAPTGDVPTGDAPTDNAPMTAPAGALSHAGVHDDDASPHQPDLLPAHDTDRNDGRRR